MLTIVWDVDDVLNELMRNWLERKWLPEHHTCSARYETLTRNPPHEVLGIGIDEYLQSLDAFRLSDDFRQLTPASEVAPWFHRFGHRFRHIALTATPILCAPRSADWVFRHFGNWIRTFAFVPSPRSSDPALEYDGSKSEYLQWLGKADYFIDDNPAHVEAAGKLGIRPLLVPRPWNQAKGSFSDVLNVLSSASSQVGK